MIKDRFQKLYPVIVDIETGGTNPRNDSILEIAIVTTKINKEEKLCKGKILHYHIIPHIASITNTESLKINNIKPYHPLRFAIPEKTALKKFFLELTKIKNKFECKYCVLVGHNAWFDLCFIKEAAKRSRIKHKNPFHPFICFDTTTLSAVIYKKTTLAKAIKSINKKFNQKKAHSAIYDAKKTAELFFHITNQFK